MLSEPEEVAGGGRCKIRVVKFRWRQTRFLLQTRTEPGRPNYDITKCYGSHVRGNLALRVVFPNEMCLPALTSGDDPRPWNSQAHHNEFTYPAHDRSIPSITRLCCAFVCRSDHPGLNLSHQRPAAASPLRV